MWEKEKMLVSFFPQYFQQIRDDSNDYPQHRVSSGTKGFRMLSFRFIWSSDISFRGGSTCGVKLFARDEICPIYGGLQIYLQSDINVMLFGHFIIYSTKMSINLSSMMKSSRKKLIIFIYGAFSD